MKIFVPEETLVVDFVETLADFLLTQYPDFNKIKNSVEFSIDLVDENNNVFPDVNNRVVFTDEGVIVFK